MQYVDKQTVVQQQTFLYINKGILYLIFLNVFIQIHFSNKTDIIIFLFFISSYLLLLQYCIEKLSVLFITILPIYHFKAQKFVVSGPRNQWCFYYSFWELNIVLIISMKITIGSFLTFSSNLNRFENTFSSTSSNFANGAD